MFSFPSLFSADNVEPIDEWTREQNRLYLETLARRERWRELRDAEGPLLVNNLDYAV